MLRWQGIEIHINIRYSFIHLLISFYNSKRKRSAINGVIQSFLLSTVILLCENLWNGDRLAALTSEPQANACDYTGDPDVVCQ